jgi:hypothetical protein
MEKKVIKQNNSNYDFSQNQKFYKSHIAGEQREGKTTNHVGDFDKVKYHKVMKKTIRKNKPQKYQKKLELLAGQHAFIAKDVTVKEFGTFKAGLTERKLDFEVAGKETAGGVIPEHLHRCLWNLRTVVKRARTETVRSQGGTEYQIEPGRPYAGWNEEAVEEGMKSDMDLYGGATWMDDLSYDQNFPNLS